eukprot:4000168-Heterocapsa_arctica.AAC.1
MVEAAAGAEPWFAEAGQEPAWESVFSGCNELAVEGIALRQGSGGRGPGSPGRTQPFAVAGSTALGPAYG